MIIELHRKTKNNIGDYFCNASRYFPIECVSRELLHETEAEGNTVIIGGGGLIHKKFGKKIQDIISQKPKHTILWGIGHNFSPKAITKGDMSYYPQHLMDCDLVGIRDWIDGYHDSYLPCVSCMHPAFDQKYKSKHDIIYFCHAFKSYFDLDGQQWMKNDEQDFDKVIEFLGSGETIITDSYHGAYWGQLLGKNVQVVSWSVKFEHMKHKPVFLKNINQSPTIQNNKVDGFLEECRDLNERFYQKFENLL